jgi:hypothetical protein
MNESISVKRETQTVQAGIRNATEETLAFYLSIFTLVSRLQL